MRKVILYIAMSLDGYIAKKNGGVGWLNGDGSEPDAMGSYPKFYESVDTIVMGWNTYHQITTELAPNNWPYKRRKSYVITHREKENEPEIVFVNDDLIELIEKLKKQSEKNIWICGGAGIAQQLIKANMIDEFYFSIIPTILGKGIRLLPDLQDELQIKLVKTESYNGIVDLVYEKR